MKAKVNLKENVSYSLRDKNGKVKRLFQENKLWKFFSRLGVRMPAIPMLFGQYVTTKKVSNLITTAGKAAIADIISDQGSTAPFTYVAVGTGTTAANVADTTLETELASAGLSRAVGTASQVTTDTTDDTAQVVKAFTVTGTAAVTEAGLLNAASSGTLLARQVFSAINVVNGDSLTITWQIDID